LQKLQAEPGFWDWRTIAETAVRKTTPGAADLVDEPNFRAGFALSRMSDAHHYFMAHAVRATLKARKMPRGRIKKKQRVAARVYHLLAKEAAYASNLHHMDDFRTAREAENAIRLFA
jgi:hypothetical protein